MHIRAGPWYLLPPGQHQPARIHHGQGARQPAGTEIIDETSWTTCSL